MRVRVIMRYSDICEALAFYAARRRGDEPGMADPQWDVGIYLRDGEVPVREEDDPVVYVDYNDEGRGA